MKCNNCNSIDAHVRLHEIKTAIHSQHANVDCMQCGVSQYRSINKHDLSRDLSLCETPWLILHLDVIYTISIDDNCEQCGELKPTAQYILKEAARCAARRRWNGIADDFNQWDCLGFERQGPLEEKEMFRFQLEGAK